MFHLELGSEGHSFNGRMIVVNSRTGQHLTSSPLMPKDAILMKKFAEEKPKFIKEEKKIAEEADARIKAVAGLRKVEEETKARNERREIKAEHKAKEAKAEAETKTPHYRIGKAFNSADREVEPANYLGDYRYTQVLSGVSDLKEYIEKYVKFVLKRTNLAHSDADYFPVKLRPDGDKWNVLFDSTNLDKVSKQSSALSYKDWERLTPKIKSIFETKIKLDKERRVKEAEERKVKEAKDKAEREAKQADLDGRRKANLASAEAKRKVDVDKNLKEFIATAPEDITGVDYGKTKKQQGVITKMVGDVRPIQSMIEQSHSNNATFGAAELIGLLHTLSLVADKRKSNKIERTSAEYGRSRIEPSEVETPADKYYDRSVRLIVNHFPKLLTAGNPKDLTKGMGFLILPPTPKALNTLRGLLGLAEGVRLEAEHKTGAYGNVSSDKYEYGVKASEADAASERATGILNSFFLELKEGAYLYLEKTEKAHQEKKVVLKASGMMIPQGAKNAVRVELTRQGVYDLAVAITGSEAKANKYVEDNLEKYQEHMRREPEEHLYVYKARVNAHLIWK